MPSATKWIAQAADLLTSQLRLDAIYYITRVLIPPLERIFNLVGADVRQWYDEMPKTLVPELVSPRKPKAMPPPTEADETNIGGHFMSTQCLSCGEPAPQSMEIECTEIIISRRYRYLRKLLPFHPRNYCQLEFSD